MKIKKYLRVYRALVTLNAAEQTAFRTGFYTMLLDSMVWGIFQYIVILLLTVKVKSVYGWSRNELIILVASYSFFWGIFHFLLARNFSRISRILTYAQLDFILAKPINSQFFLSLGVMNFAGLFRTFLATGILIYMLKLSHIAVSLVNVVSFLTLGLFGLVMIYSFWFIVVTFLIWNPRLSNLIDLLYQITGVTRLPPQVVYGVKNYFLFFLIPLTFAFSTPTKALLHKALLGDVGWLLFFTILIFLISRQFWKFALRFYTSASG